MNGFLDENLFECLLGMENIYIKKGCFVILPLFPLSCPVNNTGIAVLSYIVVNLPGASRECREMLKWEEGSNFCLPFFFFFFSERVFDLFS